MTLRDIPYKVDYRTGYDDLAADLFRPSLRVATDYWRAVGYFSSSILEAFGSPLGEFIKSGGNIRLVTSVELTESDLRAIERGTSKRDVCGARLDAILDEQFADGVGDGVTRLGLLLELGRLDIRIAVPKTGTGIYHEKIGIFLGDDEYVAFTGSSNESRHALENNRECVDVYTSWESPTRARSKRAHFAAIWDGTDQGVDVYEFPEAVRRKLIRVCRTREAKPRVQRKEVHLWPHQQRALDVFLQVERGVLNMATGTGKTRTAIAIIRALFMRSDIDTVIVTMDGTDLLNQWHVDLLRLRNSLPKPPEVYRDYDDRKEVQSFSLDNKNAVLLVSRQGGRSRDPLSSAIRSLSTREAARTMLIHDEVHRLGSPATRERLKGLAEPIRYRLGLSATPERDYDQEGNAFIAEHIGEEITECSFGLDDAIRGGILAPFRYFALTYALSDGDRERISAVFRKRAARREAGNPMSNEEVWIEIARVYKTSPAKLPVFSQFIAERPDILKRCIIFVETMEYGQDVLDIVHSHHADFHPYFSGEESKTLRRFAGGELECLVTCHRLSEGIDIRSLNSVILFASARARLETIQRIGRCLRTDPDNPGKIANIVDFIRESDADAGPEEPHADQLRLEWLSELSKLREGQSESRPIRG